MMQVELGEGFSEDASGASGAPACSSGLERGEADLSAIYRQPITQDRTAVPALGGPKWP